MESKARVFGHPVHPKLVAFPLGLLGGAVIFDLLSLATGWATFAETAYWLILLGVLLGLLAAPFGLADWLALPVASRARRIGAWHGIGNVAMLLLFLVSAWQRTRTGTPDALGYGAAFAGIAVAFGAAWLGGELVFRLGVGVADRERPPQPVSRGQPETAARPAPADRGA